MDFSDALRACKAGSKIARAGWNGSSMYVVYQKGYPDGIAINGNTSLRNSFLGWLVRRTS